jgi:hypothetical protein
LDARFELLTNEQLRALAHLRSQSSSDWLAPADGYRLLVLEPGEPAVRAVLRESGTRQLFRDSHVVVLLRSARR